MARKSQQDALNKIRLALLDWDPMRLFDMGMGGLEEYDEYIPEIAKLIKKKGDLESFTETLVQFAHKKMDDAETTVNDTAPIAERLYNLDLGD